jgi:hypothetical protein
MRMALMDKVFQKVNNFVSRFALVGHASERPRRMAALEFPGDVHQGIRLENRVCVQEEQEIAVRFFRAEVSGGAQSAFLQFEKLGAFSPDGIGGPIRTAVGDDNGLKPGMILPCQGLERFGKKLLFVVSGNDYRDEGQLSRGPEQGFALLKKIHTSLANPVPWRNGLRLPTKRP